VLWIEGELEFGEKNFPPGERALFLFGSEGDSRRGRNHVTVEPLPNTELVSERERVISWRKSDWSQTGERSSATKFEGGYRGRGRKLMARLTGDEAGYFLKKTPVHEVGGFHIEGETADTKGRIERGRR